MIRYIAAIAALSIGCGGKVATDLVDPAFGVTTIAGCAVSANASEDKARTIDAPPVVYSCDTGNIVSVFEPSQRGPYAPVLLGCEIPCPDVAPTPKLVDCSVDLKDDAGLPYRAYGRCVQVTQNQGS